MKKINMTVLACALAFTFAACSKEQTPAKTESTETKQEESVEDTTKESKESKTGSTSLSSEENKAKEAVTTYPYKLTTYDVEGKEYQIEIAKEPEKVVATNLSSTEMMLALGLKDKIVGIVKPDNKVEGEYAEDINSLKVLGDKKTMSKEIVIAENADLMIGRAALFSGKGLPTIDESTELGVNVVTQKASLKNPTPKLETVIEDLREYANIFNVASKAEEISGKLESTIKETDSYVEKNKGETMKVLAMTNFNGETFGSFQVNSGLAFDIISRLNLEAVQEEGNSELNLENLLAMNPDIILYVTATRNSENDKEAVSKLTSNEGLKEVSAIKNNKIIEIGYDDFMDYGMRAIYSYKTLAESIYGN